MLASSSLHAACTALRTGPCSPASLAAPVPSDLLLALAGVGGRKGLGLLRFLLLGRLQNKGSHAPWQPKFGAFPAAARAGGGRATTGLAVGSTVRYQRCPFRCYAYLAGQRVARHRWRLRGMRAGASCRMEAVPLSSASAADWLPGAVRHIAPGRARWASPRRTAHGRPHTPP